MIRQPFNTPLTRLLGIRTPVVSASMTGVSGAELAARVTKGGGFGFIGIGTDDGTKATAELARARTILGTPPSERVNVGIGFLGWLLNANPHAHQLVRTVLDGRPRALWFFAGDNHTPWIEFVRKYDAERGLGEAERTLIFVQLNSVEEALKAVEDGVDAIVVQGIEAGGHGSTHALPLLTLLPTVLRALPPSSSSSPRPVVLTSGGLTHGPHLAALLALGAHGIALGTRFLVSPSSLYAPAKKAALLAASSASAVRSFTFDELMPPAAWPAGMDGRALANAILTDKDEGLEIEERKRLFKESAEKGSDERLIVWAGVGVGLVDTVKEVEDIVNELHDDAFERIQTAAQMIGQ
ncbi:hypothetical protein BOTBODRAFT_29987 [Botryobasidium botryosum FD-172 SS1]|uniref:Nitronate monooxygenase domain-containing protein n=1 Tax=Botryobasidium botryosum (strain FD-172 SS1) TaxID=930990 RepID=A0A067MN27_BOTB1|nr:hypothetical protein BOTBODRAFT_29987 [Botryobasidium botryosum FD-172 SS1]